MVVMRTFAAALRAGASELDEGGEQPVDADRSAGRGHPLAQNLGRGRRSVRRRRRAELRRVERNASNTGPV